MTRTGQEYLDALRDGRTVWLDGEQVKDVTEHPAFRNTARSIAHLYDLACDESFRDVLTVRPGEGAEAFTQSCLDGYDLRDEPGSAEDAHAQR